MLAIADVFDLWLIAAVMSGTVAYLILAAIQRVGL